VKTRFQPAIEKDGHYRDQLGIDRSRIVVGQVGHLSKHKRPDFLIRSFSSALKQSPGLHLVLVGYGPLYDELQTLIEDTGLQHAVTLTGYVPDVLPYTSMSLISMCLPRAWKDSVFL
jgi:glycosyltransferase involved in cell wall biosynthesis